jgi:hypothetical protein
MAEQTWFKTVGTRLKVESARNETRPVHVVISVDSSDDEGKERPFRERKLCAKDIVMLALPDFRPGDIVKFCVSQTGASFENN